MDTLSFIAEIIKSLAWPVCVVLMALIFRQPIRECLRILTRVKYGGFEFEFGAKVAELAPEIESLPKIESSQSQEGDRERLLRLAAVSPEGAVVEAWRLIEQRLVEVAHQHRIEVAPAVWAKPMVLSALMRGHGLLTEAQADLLPRLKYLRDQVTHSKDAKILMDEAIRYSDLALQVIASIPDRIAK